MPESKGRIRQYEAMFLVSPAVGAEMQALVDELNGFFDRIEANVIALSKWDERRLAYEIDKNKRGVYLLAYFTCDPVRVQELEHQSNLSERVLRVMITSAEHLAEDEMRAADNRDALATESALREDNQPAEQGAASE